ncbi:MAG: hypothetical protein IIC90_10110 [Chloroflexi bacterium]|nr:hypothetical protein [Chloroflexota bacterium]
MIPLVLPQYDTMNLAMDSSAQDEFESATENAALVEHLRRRIDADGPISWR